MLDGLGLAETTPGPLIMVLQFVGFMGGWQNAGNLSPWQGGIIGALITTWVTFVPCFLWILLGAPYIERLRDQARLNSALSAITAAVVGVVLNLAVWFGLRTLFPDGGVNWFAIVVGVMAFLGMWRWKWGIVPVVLGSGAFGLVYHWLAGR
jgi:chromate transporter